MLPSSITIALLANSAVSRLTQGLFDDTFSGIHQLSWFDWALLIPYFAILAVLSVYGLHRYDVIRTYFKHRKKIVTQPVSRFEQLPPVTIQLPLYNERYVVERLIDEVVKMEYPKELLQIQVLDDSTDDTHPFAEALVERYRALGIPIEYHHRTNRDGYKAGALQAGLETATGELVAIFDADLRRKAIEDAGGWQHDTLTEDSDLSYRAQLAGWRFVYLPGLDCPSELPVEMHGFQIQQSRWAKGLTQVAKKLLPRILKADVPKRVKFEAIMHLTPNISYPLMVVRSALMRPVMIVRFYMGVFQMFFLDMPLIIASFWSISAFYIVAQRELYPKSWKRSIFLLPLLMGEGVGLTIINTRAVIEALFGVKTGFVRTPKYAIEGRPMKLESKRYRRKSGWLPYFEISVGTYFLGMVAYAVESNNFLAIPFLLLFVAGYYWAGFATLYQEYQGKLRWMQQRHLELGTAR